MACRTTDRETGKQDQTGQAEHHSAAEKQYKQGGEASIFPWQF